MFRSGLSSQSGGIDCGRPFALVEGDWEGNVDVDCCDGDGELLAFVACDELSELSKANDLTQGDCTERDDRRSLSAEYDFHCRLCSKTFNRPSYAKISWSAPI
jgi:hypothetical protein